MPAPAPSPEELSAARQIMMWKDFVPVWMRFPLTLLIIIVFMCSGGVYMTAVTEMTGSLAWNREDVLMAGYASMTGLTVAFPVLFRILFRFRPRDILLVSAAVFIICDYICMVSDFLPVVVLMSFISGFFRIVSTFVCWNNIQLRITPSRDFSVFFPFLFAFVLSSVQLANIITGYSIYAFDWKAMHRITIGAFLLMSALIFFCMRRHYRQGPYIPFKGIDYLGGILWTLWLLNIIFIFVYGEYYDWFGGQEIRIATLSAFVLLGICLHRAGRVRHPYISLGTFTQPKMLYIFILFGCMAFMSTTSTSTQNIFTGSILGYDARHNADITWGVAAGTALGAWIFYLALAKWKWRIKSILMAGFASFMIYQVSLYFLIDPATEKYMLYLPLVCKGAGVSLVYTSLTYALTGYVTFAHYFEAMCVIGFIRTSFGTPLCSAILTRMFNIAQRENTADLGSYIDSMYMNSGSFNSLYTEFQRQITMVSIKEVYGYAVIAAILIILAIMMSDYRNILDIKGKQIPKLSSIWKFVRNRNR